MLNIGYLWIVVQGAFIVKLCKNGRKTWQMREFNLHIRFDNLSHDDIPWIRCVGFFRAQLLFETKSLFHPPEKK